MKILLSNDDGVQAIGLWHLAEQLSTLAKIIVVAPDRDHSGVSNSLTLDRPLRAMRMPNGFLSVNGTPTDSVHLAITGLLTEEEDPDMVVSGINSGANLGDDVIYSGTVAAAMEGRFLGYPAIAVSLASNQCLHYETAAQVVKTLITHLIQKPLPADTILNVNVPDVPFDQLQGFAITRLGNRHRAERVVAITDPRGRLGYWIGPPGDEQDAGEGTDFAAINARQVSITPLQVDLTRHQAIPQLTGWLSGI
jgi:5'-nucleotidase